MLRKILYALGLAALAAVCLYFGAWTGLWLLEAFYLWVGIGLPSEIRDEIHIIVLLLPGALGFWAIARWLLHTYPVKRVPTK